LLGVEKYERSKKSQALGMRKGKVVLERQMWGAPNGALQIPRLRSGFPVESCGFGSLHVVLFKENHTSGTGESGEAGNPGSLLMNNLLLRYGDELEAECFGVLLQAVLKA
jgi:hypothetical protein